MDELLTTSQLAERLQVTTKTVQRMTASGRIPAIRVAGTGRGHPRYVWAEVLDALRPDTERHEGREDG